ncbi:MAG: hypothetical protein WD750_00090 [Gammaproteobacteria bacterium]
MSDKTLRQLTRAYAKGDLDRDQYRKARAELINGILAGDITVPEKDYAPPVKPRSVEDTVEEVTERKSREKNPDGYPETEPARKKPPYPEERSQAAPAATGNLPLWVGVAGVIVIAGLVYILLPDSSRENDASPGTAEPTADSGNTAETTPEVATSEARNLVRAFLQERSWTRESIESFVSTWQTLPVDQRQAVRGSVEMSRLGNAIYKQLLAEKALSNLDDGNLALEKQKLLVNFAREMRIDDPRITMPAETDQE